MINIKKKMTLNYPKYNSVCSYGIFSLGTQERVRNSRGKRAIGVRAIEGLLYNICDLSNLVHGKMLISVTVGNVCGYFVTFSLPSS